MDKIFIGFTGHRDCRTSDAELDRIAATYPGATWVHGDAPDGFDAQVRAYAEAHDIEHDPHPPKYRFPGDREAPLLRNREIVNKVIRLFACYDGVRHKGGTVHTMNYAKRCRVPIEYVECLPIRDSGVDGDTGDAGLTAQQQNGASRARRSVGESA